MTGSALVRRQEDGTVVSLVGLATVTLRNLRLLLACALVGAGIALAIALLKGPSYTAESIFMPQSQEQDLGALAGMAAQFGLRIPSGGTSGESLDFYAQLVRSRRMLTDLATAEYEVVDDGAVLRGTLIELYEIDGDDDQERLQNAVERLEKDITVGLNLEANVVAVRTRAEWEELAVALNRGLLDRLAEFNLRLRQTQARAERVFAEERLAEAQTDLTRMEARMKEFIERNRTYENSPQLTFEAATLQRQIDLRQQVFTSLATAYEQAKLSEVRNTPVITIVDVPEGSAERSDGKLPVTVLLGAFAGMMLGLMVVLARELIAWHRTAHPEDHAELQRAWRRVLPGRSRTALPAG